MTGSALADAQRQAESTPLDALDVSRMDRFATDTHWPFFARLRREAPVHYCAQSIHGPYWSITRYADVNRVERDFRRFSSAGNVIIGDVPPEFDAPAFATSDPPVHTAERKAVAPALGPRRLARLESEIRREIQDILDALPLEQEFNWVERVAVELTTRMVAILFDFPRNERRLLPYWAEVLVTTPGPGAIIATWEERKAILDEYLERVLCLWRERCGDPSRDDVIALLANHPNTASMIADEKHLIGTVTMIAGANEAARGAISGGVVAFDRFPKQWELLRTNPGLLTNAVAEIVRWQTPITHMRRTATEDVEFAGQRIRRGDRVVMWYCSANRDEAVFEDADQFRIDRPNARRHAGYGFGIHHCLGRHVAALELRLLWEEILKRFKHLRVTAPPRRLASNFSANYSEVRVRLSA
jgi:cytochrome P450